MQQGFCQLSSALLHFSPSPVGQQQHLLHIAKSLWRKQSWEESIFCCFVSKPAQEWNKLKQALFQSS